MIPNIPHLKRDTWDFCVVETLKCSTPDRGKMHMRLLVNDCVWGFDMHLFFLLLNECAHLYLFEMCVFVCISRSFHFYRQTLKTTHTNNCDKQLYTVKFCSTKGIPTKKRRHQIKNQRHRMSTNEAQRNELQLPTFILCKLLASVI